MEFVDILQGIEDEVVRLELRLLEMKGIHAILTRTHGGRTESPAPKTGSKKAAKTKPVVKVATGRIISQSKMPAIAKEIAKALQSKQPAGKYAKDFVKTTKSPTAKAATKKPHPLKGRKVSEETRLKMTAAQQKRAANNAKAKLGRPKNQISAEGRKRISEAVKARWAAKNAAKAAPAV